MVSVLIKVVDCVAGRLLLDNELIYGIERYKELIYGIERYKELISFVGGAAHPSLSLPTHHPKHSTVGVRESMSLVVVWPPSPNTQSPMLSIKLTLPIFVSYVYVPSMLWCLQRLRGSKQ
jgi:hypothetical protein